MPDSDAMMRNSGDRPANRRPLLVTAALISAGAVIVAIAVATGALKLGKSGDPAPSAEQSAQQRCESEVMKLLVSPAKATISGIRTESSTLDVDGRDFSSLAASEPLKGIDTARITVLNVSGVVNAPSEVGSAIQDHFDCRAYFVDGALAHSLVVFDHGHGDLSRRVGVGDRQLRDRSRATERGAANDVDRHRYRVPYRLPVVPAPEL